MRAAHRAAPVAPRSRVPLVVGGLFAVTFAWAGAATFYIAFRDELAQTFLARQTELRLTYEDRIVDLKARLEREVTANLVERRGVAARLEAVAARQATLEARQSWLSGLAGRLSGRGASPSAAITGSIPPPAALPAASSPPAAAASGKPVPIPDEPLDLELRGRADDKHAAAHLNERLSALDASLSRVAEGSLRAVETLRQETRERSQTLRVALDATRIDTRRIAAREGPMGGPLVALPRAFDEGSFHPLAADAEAGLGEFERLAATARALPLARPLFGELEQTSGFGYRLDPFTRGPALHTGLDFRAEAGSPVLATGAGRVIAAEAAAGYGRMVEIEHEGGVTTRYGHLSSIAVMPGQVVAAGEMIGRAGASGRATGVHLHYETRIGGEPVNPARFLDAGRLIATGDLSP